jgi:hypothetical protein
MEDGQDQVQDDETHPRFPADMDEVVHGLAYVQSEVAPESDGPGFRETVSRMFRAR